VRNSVLEDLFLKSKSKDWRLWKKLKRGSNGRRLLKKREKKLPCIKLNVISLNSYQSTSEVLFAVSGTFDISFPIMFIF